MSDSRWKFRIGIGLMAASLICMAAAAVLSSERHVQGIYRSAGRSAAVNRLIIPEEEAIDAVNLADAEGLTELPGIGPSLARVMFTEKTENGSFFYPEDLLSVKGIGSYKLEQIRNWMNRTDK